MSDDDMDMMYEDEIPDEEENNDEEEESGEVDAENEYFNAKSLIEDDLAGAIEGFENVVKIEKEKGEWGFKSLKKLTKLYHKKGNNKKVLEKFQQFLEHSKFVTGNYSEKGINSILDAIGSGKEVALIQQLYQICLDYLKATNNERVWFRTNLKLGKLLYDHDEHAKLAKILKELHKACQNEQGEDDIKKGSLLVDIYALEIQMYTATKNNKKLKELYQKALEIIRTAIPHPKIMGIIRECGGKMHMREKEWEKAHTDFFEAFKNYDEAGSPRRIQCLKYLVLANMLMLSEIDPFEATELKPYKNDSEIIAMNNLVNAYHNNDIKTFEKILKDNKKTILDDPFMKDYSDDLLRNIRTQVMLKILSPYTKIRIHFVSQELNITSKEVEDLMVGLILDCKIRGRVDQVNQLLELEPSKYPIEFFLITCRSIAFSKFKSLDKWATQLTTLQIALFNKLP